MAKVNLTELDALVQSKHITKRKHPTLDLWIYNYTPICQYEGVWNEYTLMCRGLVLDAEGNIIARPLKKFFNYDEPMGANAPWHLPFEITEKVDGSMLLVVKYNEQLVFATRGSFESEQAAAGRELYLKYNSDVNIADGWTYVFEVIYPENRIVINYDGYRGLYFLACINTNTGEKGFVWLNTFECVRRPATYKVDIGDDLSSIPDTIKGLEDDAAEGFVVRFTDGSRVKIKLDEYKRLHRLVTGVSTKTVWEYLRDGKDFSELLEHVPDEFNAWVRNTKQELEGRFNTIDNYAGIGWAAVYSLPTRKEQADWLFNSWPIDNRKDLAHVVFARLDHKDYKSVIWKLIEPARECPFEDRGN